MYDDSVDCYPKCCLQKRKLSNEWCGGLFRPVDSPCRGQDLLIQNRNGTIPRAFSSAVWKLRWVRTPIIAGSTGAGVLPLPSVGASLTIDATNDRRRSGGGPPAAQPLSHWWLHFNNNIAIDGYTINGTFTRAKISKKASKSK